MWLDVKNPNGQSVKDMKLGVAECEIFVCILSETYMKSEYCLLELKEAIRLKKKVLMPYNTDSISKKEIGKMFSQAKEAGIFAKDWPSAFPISRGLYEMKLAVEQIQKLSRTAEPIKLIT